MEFRRLVLICAFTITFLDAAAQTKLLSIHNDLDSSTENIPWINHTNVVKGDAFSGELFTIADSIHPFGLGYKGSFPEVCVYRNLHLSISECLRIKQPAGEIELVVTISYGDSLIFYNSKNISTQLLNINSWTKIKDEIDLPATLTGSGYTVAIYLWNKDGISPVEIDDLEIDFEERIMPSFLPPGFTTGESNVVLQKIMSDKNYSFYYGKEQGELIILGNDGDTIINSCALYTEWIDGDKRMSSWNKYLFFRNDSAAEEGKYIKLSAHDKVSQSEIVILAGVKGSLTYNVSTVFISPVTLVRHSIITGFSLPVTKVFKKNTLTDSINLKREYWLDREGFILSNGRNTLAMYHPDEVSSIQLDVVNKYAIFNLDYSADHPLLHFPLLKKSQNKFVDRSTSVYNIGDRVNTSFTFYPVAQNFKIAKQLINPYGFLSAFIWTEHADYTNLRTHRAVYYGAENINRLEEATGGFLKYSIPVTKSIFYSNPDGVDNSDKAGFMPGPVANYKETEGFMDFIRQLNEYGIEICLHTPDHFTCTRNLLSEALDVTKREFFPTTWIDHGYDNSIKSNREDLACDGADVASEFYAADLWTKYGIKYFWNSFFEDSDIYKKYNFNSFFSVPYSGWDDAMPTPLSWQNKTRTGEIIHWKTTSTMDPEDGSLWQYYFNDLRLSDAVNNRSNVILHCYPARVDSTNGFYSLKDGIVVANDGFNQTLSKLSQYRAKKMIWLTTIREMLDYKRELDKIKFEFLPSGLITINNTGKNLIRGISFSTSAKEVNAGNKEVSKKYIDNEMIFWFDIQPGEKVNITLN